MQVATRLQQTADIQPRVAPIALLTERVQTEDGTERDEFVLRFKINCEEIDLIRECRLGAVDHEQRAAIERAVSEITECKGWANLLETTEGVAFPAIAEANRYIEIQECTLRKLAAKVGLKPQQNSLLRNYRDLDTGPFKSDFDAVVLLSQFALASKVLSTLLSERIVAAVREIVESATDDERISPSKLLWLKTGERLLCESLAKWRQVPANVLTFETRVAELRRILKKRS